ncbi:hypothetical protein C8Q74DRAFT_784281 [Fomes fomentarius]|nr:hypothetical protein C8Q74DRAFT_784281 [Fomes fomentarius]
MVHSAGSYSEPIVISDEEDAAFVENELSRWTDSSNSSSSSPVYSPTYSPTYDNSYTAITESLPAPPSSIAPAPEPSPPPVVPPPSGQKRKWTDMGESSSTSQLQHPSEQPWASAQASSSKKKKKQRKERQRNHASSSAGITDPHTRTHSQTMAQDATIEPQFSNYLPSLYQSHQPYDYAGYGSGFAWPMGPFQMAGNAYISPEDEYRPTDGPLWNPSERPSILSALAAPYYPPFAAPSYSVSESLLSSLQPSARLPSPPADTDRPSHSSASTYEPRPLAPPSPPSPDGPQAELSSSFKQPFDTSLEPLARVFPERPGHAAVESLKRLIGIPEDKANHGFFDLSAPNLDPPAPPAPIPPVADFTLVMAQLPKKFRNTSFVTLWAKRHGNPIRVILDVKSGKALIEWMGAHSTDSAFTSLRLRGDGKEHIRVYRYRGDKPPASRPPPSGLSTRVEKEMEEGEIEEGEVVETSVKSKKKKNKGKKKALQLEQRLTEPISAAPAVPHQVVLSTFSSSSFKSPFPESAAPARPLVSKLRQPLIERFSDPPSIPAAQEETWEEEMELDSDGDIEASVLPPPPPPPLVFTSALGNNHVNEEEDMDLDDAVDEVWPEEAEYEDEDMDMSSVAGGSSPPPSGPEILTTSVPASEPPVVPPTSNARDTSPIPEVALPVPEVAVPSPDIVARSVEGDQVAINVTRRHKLEEAIARTKAELKMRALASSSRTSFVSSNGSSESPEPVTPLGSPILDHAQVAVASTVHAETIVTAGNESAVDADAPMMIKTEVPAVNLDDLASSFISETIHAVRLSPRSSSPTSPTITASAEVPIYPSTSTTASISVTIPVPKTAQAPTPLSPKYVTIPITDEQKQYKQKQWLDLVSASRSLFGKMTAAGTKEEKDLLMRLLRAKTKAADKIKRELDLGVVVIEVHDPLPSPTFASMSATPTPVPSSRMSSATPTPTATPTPSAVVPQKRKSSPTVPFRWPETAREIIIIVSDDEAD